MYFCTEYSAGKSLVCGLIPYRQPDIQRYGEINSRFFGVVLPGSLKITCSVFSSSVPFYSSSIPSLPSSPSTNSFLSHPSIPPPTWLCFYIPHLMFYLSYLKLFCCCCLFSVSLPFLSGGEGRSYGGWYYIISPEDVISNFPRNFGEYLPKSVALNPNTQRKIKHFYLFFSFSLITNHYR